MAVSSICWFELVRQNIEENNSIVNFCGSVTCSGASFNNYTKTGTWSCNGQSGTFETTLPREQTHRMFTITLTIPHNADGTKTVTGSFTLATGISAGTLARSAALVLPSIPRHAKITNCIGNFDDETDPWLEVSNPGGFTLKGWLEVNPVGDHLFEISSQGNQINWELTAVQRKLLRQYCTKNNQTIRLGVLTEINGIFDTNNPDYRDRIITIKDSQPDVGTITWNSTNLLELTDESTVIKGCSNIAVTIPEATAKKEAKIVQYKVVCGSQEVTSITAGTLNLNNVDDNTINVYVSDSRENVIENKLTITNFIEYTKPIINNLSLVRTKGGIDSNVILSFDGKALFKNFGKVNNEIQVEYYYKVQGSSSNWTLGTTDLLQEMNYGTDSFSNSLEIAGDLGNNGFDIANNYDFKIVVTDKTGDISKVEKTTILTSGIPNMAIHKQGVAFGGFYDPASGGAIQLLGKNIIDLFYPVGVQIYNDNNDFDPNDIYGTWEKKIKKVNCMVSGTAVVSGTADSRPLHNWTTICDKFETTHGFRPTDSVALGVSVVNGDGVATDVHIEGATWVGAGLTELYAVMNKSVTGAVRVNYAYFYNKEETYWQRVE